MKAKKLRRNIRKQANAALKDNIRFMWAKLVRLPRRERIRLAWMLLRGDADIDGAVKRKGGE